MDLDEVLKVLKARGLNLTPQRQEILRALLEGPPHQTAAEILQRVRRRFPSISFDTVYRNLHLLQSLNLVS
ncbi:MAG: Fur family transcriptional regulator, partial [Desulfotomaculales bacterium]